MSGSCTCWKAKSTDLFFLDNRSQISSFTMVAVRYLQFAGGGYFFPRSFTESCGNSPVKILFTRPAIFSSMLGDCLMFGSNAWVRLSRKSLFVQQIAYPICYGVFILFIWVKLQKDVFSQVIEGFGLSFQSLDELLKRAL